MKGARRLIVNADGFGFGPGATEGILEAIAAGGLITSVSVNANFPDSSRVEELLATFPEISIGVHLNPVVGRPCLDAGVVRTLIDAAGNFHRGNFVKLLRRGRIAKTELEAELDCQIERMHVLTRGRLTHLDSHQHSHLHYLPLTLRLAKKWHIPCMRTNASLICLEARNATVARAKVYLSRPHVLAAHSVRRVQMLRARSQGLMMADRLVTIGYARVGNKANRTVWERLLHNLPEGTFEVYCHPGYPDSVLRQHARYVEERLDEMRLMSESQLRVLAHDEGVELLSFHKLVERWDASSCG